MLANRTPKCDTKSETRHYETVGEVADDNAYPMPGQLIDVGGHRLYMDCTGSGSPTVVLEPGARRDVL